MIYCWSDHVYCGFHYQTYLGAPIYFNRRLVQTCHKQCTSIMCQTPWCHTHWLYLASTVHPSKAIMGGCHIHSKYAASMHSSKAIMEGLPYTQWKCSLYVPIKGNHWRGCHIHSEYAVSMYLSKAITGGVSLYIVNMQSYHVYLSKAITRGECHIHSEYA